MMHRQEIRPGTWQVPSGYRRGYLVLIVHALEGAVEHERSVRRVTAPRTKHRPHLLYAHT
eukprot:1911235-Rhodomonas_salina.2